MSASAAFRSLVLAIGVIVWMGCSRSDRGSETPSAPDVLSVTVPADLAVPRGGTVHAAVGVRVDASYHVMANPASADYFVPLRLELAPAENLEVGATIYPEGIPFSVNGIADPISTYENEVVLTVPLTAAAEAPSGRRTLVGNLYYQACSQHACLIPSSMPVKLEVEITAHP